MQKLQTQLSSVTEALQNLSRTDLTSIDDAKTLKSLTVVIDRVLKSLSAEICNLELLKIKTLSKLSAKVATLKPALLECEKKFMIKYVTKPLTQTAQVQVDLGESIFFNCQLYQTKEAIPVMAYGAVMLNASPVVVYRYSEQDFVSVSACQIMDFNGPNDNYRTICCGNSKTCEYGNNCKYFHDPLIWPDSDHIQRFVRTNLVKKSPYFGHAQLFQDHQLPFENLRTLARYCAYMSLLISIVSKKQ